MALGVGIRRGAGGIQKQGLLLTLNPGVLPASVRVGLCENL